MKTLLALVLLLAGCVTEPRGLPATPLERKVYEINVEFANGKLQKPLNGSGVVIPKDNRLYLITAAHVVMPLENYWETLRVTMSGDNPNGPIAKRVVATDYRGEEFTCIILRVIPELDLALMLVEAARMADPITFTEIPERDVQPDEPVTMCGFTDNRYYSFPAIVGSREELVEIEMNDLRTTLYCMIFAGTPALLGCSGGPAFDKDGHLLGIISSRNSIEDPPLYTYFAAPSSIRELFRNR